MPVEFRDSGEADVIHVHIEAHADGVRRHQEVDLFVLIQSHLGVARAGAQPAHHHRAAAATAADHLGDGIDLGRREGDDRASRRQARELRRPRMAQLRQPRPRLDHRFGHQPLDQRADGLGPHEHGLHHAARAQKTVREHMPPVGIGAELDFVHADEFDMPVERHGLHRAGEPARIGRDDLFLARDQADVSLALLGHHPVIILAGQQAQRKADDARGVG
jgi:hypothetical protein